MTTQPNPTLSRAWPCWLMVVGLAGSVVAAFLPWVRSGQVERSSFAAVRSAQRLGLGDTAWQQWVLDGWYLLPLLAAMVALALVAGRRRLAAGVAFVFGAVLVTVGLVVASSSAPTGAGPVLATLTGMVVVGGSGCTLLDERRIRDRRADT